MPKTIVLLTDTVQQQRPLANLLREHNPDLAFASALSAQNLSAISPHILRNARLVSFANNVAVSETILLQLGYGAYKFYVAPAQYPGLPPASNEEDGDAPCFSAIAQSLTIWPDSTRVVGLETVTVPEGTKQAERDRIMFSRLAYLFLQLSSRIACDASDLPAVIEVGNNRRPTFAMMN